MIKILSLVLLLAFVQSSAFASNGKYYTKQYAEWLKTHRPTAPGDGKVHYYGGLVITNVKVVAVFWGPSVDSRVQQQIGTFYTSLANSSYMDMLGEYATSRGQPIGRGGFAGAATISPINGNKKLDKKEVEAELVAQIDQGKLPKPDGNTLYMIHFPVGMRLATGGEVSCSQWCADHEGFKSKYGDIYYAMMPDLSECTFGCGGGNAFDDLTVAASHELAEAVTDPMCPDIGQNPAFPAAWVAPDQNEIGDLCNGRGTTLTVQGHTFKVQAEWSNKANKCVAGPFNTPVF